MRLPPVSRLLIFMALLLSLGIGFFFFRAIDVLRADRWNAALRNGENVTQVLERSLRYMLESADQGLLSVQRRWAERPLAASRLLPSSDPNALAPLLFDGVLAPNGLSNVWLVDLEGNVLAHECREHEEPNAPLPAVFQRMHRQLRTEGTRDLQIGVPTVVKADGTAVLPMARALYDAQGRRVGAVMGVVPLAVMDQFFHTLRLGKDGMLMLARVNGEVLLRYEQVTDEGAYRRIQEDLASLRDTRFFLHGMEKGSREVADEAGVMRLYHFQQMTPYPLMVLVGQPCQAILAEWRHSAWQLGGYAVVLLLACWGLTLALCGELHRRQRIQERLQVVQHDLQTIFDNLPSVICYWDTSLHCRYINRYSKLWYGLLAEDAPGKHVRDLLGQDAYEYTLPYLERALQGLPQLFERTFTDVQGELRHIYVSYTPDMKGSEVRGIFVQVTDITERKRMEDVLFEEKERMRLTLQAIGDAVFCTDQEGRVMFLNPVAEHMTGWQAFDAAGQMVREVAPLQISADSWIRQHEAGPDALPHPMCVALTRRSPQGPIRATVLHRDGQREAEVEVFASPIVDRHGVLAGGVLVLRNVTETVALAERMTQLAQYDTLTGLPNRLLLEARASEAMAQARRNGKGLAVMYLDLDGFKEVNDGMGHDIGDELLVQFAQRLASSVRSSDTVCRLGGDEFLLLLPGVSTQEALQTVAAKTMELCNQPFVLRDGTARLGMSAGVALYPAHGERFEIVMRHADVAMYAAKRTGRQRVCLYQGEDQPPLVLHDAPQRMAPDTQGV